MNDFENTHRLLNMLFRMMRSCIFQRKHHARFKLQRFHSNKLSSLDSEPFVVNLQLSMESVYSYR